MLNVSSNCYTVRSSIHAVPVYKSFGFREPESTENKGGINFQPMELIL
ncbi:GNAT family N-acetyltransferase [Marinomonas sp. 2405UD68-3]